MTSAADLASYFRERRAAYQAQMRPTMCAVHYAYLRDTIDHYTRLIAKLEGQN